MRDRDKHNASRRKHEPRPCADCGKQLRIGYRCRDCNHLLRRAGGRTFEEAARRQAVFVRDGWICQLCHEPINPAVQYPAPLSPSIDHVVPLSVAHERHGLGFQDTEDNWQAAHYVCNSSKGARTAS